MASCPCCSNSMLRHIRNHKIHWFCRTCWTEMPLFEAKSNIFAVLAENLVLYHQKNRQIDLACPLLQALA